MIDVNKFVKKLNKKILELLVNEFNNEFEDIIVNCPKDYIGNYDEVIIKDKDKDG